MVSITSYNRDLVGLGGHFLYPPDHEGLLGGLRAPHAGCNAGNLEDDLGPWSDTSLHVLGALGEVAFGAARCNEAETVAGAAELSIGLAALDGTLDFTELESWEATWRAGLTGRLRRAPLPGPTRTASSAHGSSPPPSRIAHRP